jgi:hypothetical protein
VGYSTEKQRFFYTYSGDLWIINIKPDRRNIQSKRKGNGKSKNISQNYRNLSKTIKRLFPEEKDCFRKKDKNIFIKMKKKLALYL